MIAFLTYNLFSVSVLGVPLVLMTSGEQLNTGVLIKCILILWMTITTVFAIIGSKCGFAVHPAWLLNLLERAGSTSC